MKINDKNAVFWKLSEAKVEGKPIYDYFCHDRTSLWWSFKLHWITMQKSQIKNSLVEDYRDVVDRYFRFSNREIETKETDVILLNTFYARKGQPYFGTIKKELEKHGLRVLEIFTYTILPLDIWKKPVEMKTLDTYFIYG